MNAKGQDKWECSMCTYLNSSGAEECEICNQRHGFYSPSSWQCTHCTMVSTDLHQCRVCDRPRPSKPDLAVQKLASVDLQQLENKQSPPHAWSDWDERERIKVSEASVMEDESLMTFPEDECRIVLVGKTGSGKSSTANTIIGLPRFQVDPGLSSTTKKCQHYRKIRFGVPIEVVDTPGLFDTSLDEEAIMKETAKCVGIISPGPHAIILVVRLGVRFTEEESRAADKVQDIFGVQLLKYLVVVFTHGDVLADDDQAGSKDCLTSLDKVLENSPTNLKRLVKNVNGRFVVFNNKGTWEQKSSQVRQLLLTIKKLLSINGGRPYTTEKLQQVEKILKERELQLTRELHGTTDKTKRSRSKAVEARNIVRDELASESSLSEQILAILKPFLFELLKILVKLVLSKVADGQCSIS